MGSMVFQYGLLPPVGNADLVIDQMRLANRYRNVLVEIDRERRDKVRAILSGHADVAPLHKEITELKAVRDAARDEIKATRKASRRRSETTAQRDNVTAMNRKIAELAAQIKIARTAVAADTVVQESLKETWVHARTRIREARAACGVYWGTYLLQEAAAEQAGQSKTPPSFMSFRGEGSVSVQLQGGMQIPELWGGDTRLQIAPVSEDAWHHPVRGVRRRASRTMLRLRVGSEGRAPIWAEWPMIMHRPLPEGATLKVATVSRRRRDCRSWEWRVSITITTPEGFTKRVVPATGAVALDLGFCRRPNGAIRSGYVVGNDGHEQEILVAKSDALRERGERTGEQVQSDRTWVTNGLAKADSIRSFRDRNLNLLRDAFGVWWKMLQEAALPSDPPAWFKERTQYVHAWRSPSRFAGLMRMWAADRFPGDELMFALLESWSRRDMHLEPYESGLRRSALRDRREGYRILAARLSARYRTLVLDGIDLAELQRAPQPEDPEHKITAIRNAQRVAAGSELRLALINAFGAERVFKTTNERATLTCSACGVVNQSWDTKVSGRIHACDACGTQWDQDANACRNRLREWHLSQEDGAISKEAVEVKPSRSERLRRAKKSAAA